LVELLIVIAIILTLMVLVYGGNARSRQLRKIAACQENLRTISVALQLYAGDYKGHFPATAKPVTSSDEPLSLLVPRYTSLTAPFICPGSRDKSLPEGEPFRGRRISYSYYTGRQVSGAAEQASGRVTPLLTDWQVDTRLKVAGDRLFSADGKSPGNNHDKYGGNILFVDGHADKSPPRASVPLLLDDDVMLLNPR
jgi:prepilin-type processing-associated H-X9-DG protein